MATIPDLSQFTDQEKVLLARYLSLHAPAEADVPIIVAMVLDRLESGEYGGSLGEVIAGLTPAGMPETATATADRWLPMLNGAGRSPVAVRPPSDDSDDGSDFWNEWYSQPGRSVGPSAGALVEQFLADPFGAFTPDEPADAAPVQAQPPVQAPNAPAQVQTPVPQGSPVKEKPLPDLSSGPSKTKTAALPAPQPTPGYEPQSLPPLAAPGPSKIGQVPGNSVGSTNEAMLLPFPWVDGIPQDPLAGVANRMVLDPEFADKRRRAEAAISGGMDPFQLAQLGFQEGPFRYSSDFPPPAPAAAPVQSATGPLNRGRPTLANNTPAPPIPADLSLAYATNPATSRMREGGDVLNPWFDDLVQTTLAGGLGSLTPNAPAPVKPAPRQPADLMLANNTNPATSRMRDDGVVMNPWFDDLTPTTTAGGLGSLTPDYRPASLPQTDDFMQDPLLVGQPQDFVGKNIGQGTSGNENLAPTPAPLPLARMAVNNALPEGAIAIDDTDREWIARAVATEVDPRLASSNPQAYQNQVYGVIDTIFNRVASNEFPDTVEGVLEQEAQFSAINGPRNRDYEVYGEVENIPAERADKSLRKITQDWISQREMGAPSSVGGALHYANPYFADSANMEWIDDLASPKYGQGESVHWHGTTDGFTPTEAVLTNPALNAISGATSISGPFDYGDPAMTSKLMQDRTAPISRDNKQKVALNTPIAKDKSDPVNEYFTALAAATKSAAKQAAQRAESGQSDTYWQQKARNKDRYGSAPSGGSSSSGSNYWQQKAAEKAAQQKAGEKSYGGGGSYTTPTQKTKSYTSPAPQTKTKDYTSQKDKSKSKSSGPSWSDFSSYWS